MKDPIRDQFSRALNLAEGPDAANLLPLVYEQLRKIAQQHMNQERRDHTLQATALVHEASLRLIGGRQIPWKNRAHFHVAAAEAIRRILIDHARARNAACRGGPAAREAALRLKALPDPRSEEESAGYLILSDALVRLESADAHAASVVRLRYSGGLTVGETARVDLQQRHRKQRIERHLRHRLFHPQQLRARTLGRRDCDEAGHGEAPLVDRPKRNQPTEKG